MAKVSEIGSYQSPWLRAEDLAGQSRRVKVERATLEDIRQADNTNQQRIVVTFVGKQKKLICNKTQAMALATALGDDTAGWLGRDVYLTPAPTPQGKLTIAVMPVPSEEAQQEGLPF